MISLNNTHPAPKAIESYRIRKEAMDAAVFIIGPHARHGFEYETFKCDGRWRWRATEVDERQPTAAMIKADGGKRAFLSVSDDTTPGRASPCHVVPSHAVPFPTTALHTGSRLEKPAAPSLTALATMITEGTPMADPNRLPVPPRRAIGKAAGAPEGSGAAGQPPAPKTLPVPSLEADGGIGPSFIAPADDLQTREAMLNDLAPACNGLDIKPMTSVESLTQTPAQNLAADLTIPAFLKREATPEAKEKAATAMKRIAKQVGPDRTIANPPDAKVAARRKAADEEAADAAKARRKAQGATSAAPVSDSPKAKKPASEAKAKTAGHSGETKNEIMMRLARKWTTEAAICEVLGWKACMATLRKNVNAAGLAVIKRAGAEATEYKIVTKAEVKDYG